MKNRTALCGVAGGVLTVAALMVPARTVIVPASAVLWPFLGGAAAAYLIYRREKSEVEIDDGLFAGILAGGVAGLIVAVPFPVGAYFRTRAEGASPTPLRIAGVGGSAIIFLTCVVLALLGAFAMVVLSRFLTREKPN